MKPVRVHRDARAELDHEIGWYEKRHRGLGLALLPGFEVIIRQIGLDPHAGAQYENRKYLSARNSSRNRTPQPRF